MTTTTTNTYRTTARIVGIIYLAGFVVGLSGQVLIQSVLAIPDYLTTLTAHTLTFIIGAILWLIAVAGDTRPRRPHVPLLKPHSERIALGYLAARIVDAVFIAVMVLFLLLQIPLASEYLKAAARRLLPAIPEHHLRPSQPIRLPNRHERARPIWSDALLHLL